MKLVLYEAGVLSVHVSKAHRYVDLCGLGGMALMVLGTLLVGRYGFHALDRDPSGMLLGAASLLLAVMANLAIDRLLRPRAQEYRPEHHPQFPPGVVASGLSDLIRIELAQWHHAVRQLDAEQAEARRPGYRQLLADLEQGGLPLARPTR